MNSLKFKEFLERVKAEQTDGLKQNNCQALSAISAESNSAIDAGGNSNSAESNNIVTYNMQLTNGSDAFGMTGYIYHIREGEEQNNYAYASGTNEVGVEVSEQNVHIFFVHNIINLAQICGSAINLEKVNDITITFSTDGNAERIGEIVTTDFSFLTSVSRTLVNGKNQYTFSLNSLKNNSGSFPETIEFGFYTYSPTELIQYERETLATSVDVALSFYGTIGLSILDNPIVVAYKVGEKFNPAGLELKQIITYSDDSFSEKTYYFSGSTTVFDDISFRTQSQAEYSQTYPQLMFNINDTYIEVKHNLSSATVQIPIVIYQTISNIPYVLNGSPKQKMDVSFPINSTEALPAVVTIHGGGWTDGVKEYYNYLTPVIVGRFNCVHVTMDYRLTSALENPSGKVIRYWDMIDDITSAIQYLKTHAQDLHIDTTKIALMGHSAGGHLALLYSYKSKYNGELGITSPIPVSVVISEAGPTDLNLDYQNLYSWRQKVENLVDGDFYSYSNEWLGKVEKASPIWYIDVCKIIPPYTFLAYSNNGMPINGKDSDGVVYYSLGIALDNALEKNQAEHRFYPLNVHHVEFNQLIYDKNYISALEETFNRLKEN